MMFIAVMMVSNVLYPVVPRFSLHTWGGRLALFIAAAAIVAAFTYPEYFFFPFSILYITYGLIRTVLAGFEEKLPDEDPMLDQEPEEVRTMELERPTRPAPAADDRRLLTEEELP